MKKIVNIFLIFIVLFYGFGIGKINNVSASSNSIKIKKDYYLTKAGTGNVTIDQEEKIIKSLISDYKIYNDVVNNISLTEEANDYLDNILKDHKSILNVITKKKKIDAKLENKKLVSIYNNKKLSDYSKISKLSKTASNSYSEAVIWTSYKMQLSENVAFMSILNQYLGEQEPLEKQELEFFKEYASAFVLQNSMKEYSKLLLDRNKSTKSKYVSLSKKHKKDKAKMEKLKFLNNELVKAEKSINKYKFGVRSVDKTDVSIYSETDNVSDAIRKLRSMSSLYRNDIKKFVPLDLDVTTVMNELNRK